MKDDNNEVEILENEKKVLLDHDYDGIRELDHPLPKWWVILFILTVVFSVPYYIAYTFNMADDQTEELQKDLAHITKVQQEYEKKEGQFDLAAYEDFWKTNPKAQKIARKTYKRKCRACHGKFGEGMVGPNLVDKFWINGDGSREAIYKVIDKGVVDKGMAAWGAKLGKKKLYALTKYILDFRGTNPENQKEPQGKEYK